MWRWVPWSGLCAVMLVAAGCGSSAGSATGSPAAIQIRGTPDVDELAGSPADEHLLGLEGNDLLDGAGGNDVLEGGPGNDAILGGAGNDLFVYRRGDGRDIIAGRGGRDGIEFGAGIAPDDLRFVEIEGLRIVVDGDPASESWSGIQVVTWGERGQYIEFIRFADGTVLSVPQIKARVQGNHAPRLTTPVQPRSVKVGERFAQDLRSLFTDPEGDPLTFIVRADPGRELPGWISYEPQQTMVTGTPGAQDVGATGLWVLAKDPSGASEEIYLPIEVHD